jgi:hypothetical protein
MKQSAVEIERVVREVLAELGALKAEGGGRRAEGQDSKLEIRNPKSKISNPQSLIPNPSPLAPPTANHLVVSARVVTMNDILGRLDSARRVVVLREAIVTPAVRDELLRRGIALEFADSSNCRPATVRLVLTVSGTEFEPAALAAALNREGLCVECTASDCLIAAVDQLAAEIAKPDTLGVLLTRHSAAGLCLANRLPAVRAITGSDAPGVAAASATVGANLLVADPQVGSFFQLKQMTTEFARGGVRPCPAVFRDRLGT